MKLDRREDDARRCVSVPLSQNKKVCLASSFFYYYFDLFSPELFGQFHFKVVVFFT